MDANKTPDPGLEQELSYYKRQLEQMSGDSIRYDFMLSSLRHELKQKQEAFAILSNLQKAFTVNTPDEEVFQITVKAMNTQLGMDRSLILLPHSGTTRFTVGAYFGFEEEVLKAIKDQIVELPLLLLQPNCHILYNRSTSSNEVVSLIQQLYGMHYFIGMPLLVEAGFLGYILTGRQYEKLPFHPPLNSSDVDTIAAIAGLIGMVFQNKRMLELRLLMKEQVNENAIIRNMLAELRATQAQLIQREKMASLGELTAGIAHEIQNPLNFVNNFSEINNELIEELKQEVQSGDTSSVLQLAGEIKENNEKISHHGNRADTIVKGMLQHSRQSTGKKEPSNINALAEEYMRLSYQAMRSKDKSFTSTIETHFDDNLGKVSVIPQHISRVLLNLFNNAFYAVNEKKKQVNGTYEPIVSITTKRLPNQVEIIVKDNGNGIAQKNIDKIFQPFFTTKPTGQGTGLGLSLSYDIVKAHGGELTVSSEEGSYSEFTILLPIT